MAHVRVGEIFLGKPAGGDLSHRLEDLCQGAFPPVHEPGSIDGRSAHGRMFTALPPSACGESYRSTDDRRVRRSVRLRHQLMNRRISRAKAGNSASFGPIAIPSQMPITPHSKGNRRRR